MSGKHAEKQDPDALNLPVAPNFQQLGRSVSQSAPVSFGSNKQKMTKDTMGMDMAMNVDNADANSGASESTSGTSCNKIQASVEGGGGVFSHNKKSKTAEPEEDEMDLSNLLYGDVEEMTMDTNLKKLIKAYEKLKKKYKKLQEEKDECEFQIVELVKDNQTIEKNMGDMFYTCLNELERKDKMIAELRKEISNAKA